MVPVVKIEPAEYADSKIKKCLEIFRSVFQYAVDSAHVDWNDPCSRETGERLAALEVRVAQSLYIATNAALATGFDWLDQFIIDCA